MIPIDSAMNFRVRTASPKSLNVIVKSMLDSSMFVSSWSLPKKTKDVDHWFVSSCQWHFMPLLQRYIVLFLNRVVAITTIKSSDIAE